MVMSLDPGKNNTAFAVTQFDLRTGLRYKILETGMIESTLTDLTCDVIPQLKRFKKEVNGIVKHYGANVIIAERFMNRGMMRGNSGEIISAMLGYLCSINIHHEWITAAQWKNVFNKHCYDLKTFYKEIPLVEHRIDASLIGIYGSSFFTPTNHFDCIKDNIKKCRLQITNTR